MCSYVLRVKIHNTYCTRVLNKMQLLLLMFSRWPKSGLYVTQMAPQCPKTRLVQISDTRCISLYSKCLKSELVWIFWHSITFQFLNSSDFRHIGVSEIRRFQISGVQISNPLYFCFRADRGTVLATLLIATDDIAIATTMLHREVEAPVQHTSTAKTRTEEKVLEATSLATRVTAATTATATAGLPPTVWIEAFLATATGETTTTTEMVFVVTEDSAAQFP